MKLAFQLDGKLVAMDVQAHEGLLPLLRERLGRRSVREGCEDGGCGSCTVLLDGQAVNACTLLALQVQGRQVETLDGLPVEQRQRVEESLLERGATGCGFCLPGIALRASELVASRLPPEELPTAMAGNRCRCTGYQPLLEALAEALGS